MNKYICLENKNEINVIGRLICSSGKTHEKQEVYDCGEVLGTIPATTYKDPPKILLRRCYVSN